MVTSLISFFRNFFVRSHKEVSWIVVGIGNVGKEYVGSRHNIGFDALEKFCRLLSDQCSFSEARAKVVRGNIGKDIVLCVWPQTYVNKSGVSVEILCRKYDVEPSHCIVVVDDFHLDLGKLRVRQSGSDGGHNGLKSIISAIGKGFPRVRIGIGPRPKELPIIDFVLGSFDETDFEYKKNSEKLAAQAIEMIIKEGSCSAMNRFNGVLPSV